MLSAGGGVKGVVLRGIDPVIAPHVLFNAQAYREGSWMPWKMAMRAGIIIGDELAKRLGLFIGGRVNLPPPASQKGAAGYTPRVKAFEVAGIFKTGMYEYDSSLAFVSLPAAREVLGLPAGFLSGIEITCA